MSVINYYAIQREVKTRAANVGLNVKFEVNCQPRTDGRNIYLEKPHPDMTEHEETVWWYMFEHELGHNHPDLMDTFSFMKEKKFDVTSFLGFLFNVLEDHRQELYDKGHYKGRDMRLQKGFHSFITKEIDPNSYGQAPEFKRLAAEALFTWDTMERVSWMPRCAGIGETIYRDNLTPEQQSWVEKLVEGEYGNILKSGIDEREEYDLCLKIIEEVFDIPKEDAEKEAQENYEANSKGSGDGSESSESSGMDSSDGAPDDGDSKGEAVSSGKSGEGSDGETAKRNLAGTVDYSDLLAHKHNDKDDTDGPTYASLTIDYSSYRPGAGWPDADLEKYTLKDYIKSPATETTVYSDRVMPEGKGLSKKVKRLLMIKGQARYEHAQKRGKISPKSLYRAAGDGDAAKRVFKKKQVNNMLDTAVMVLMDCSGSMGGGKYEHAGQSMILLNDAISPLGIPLEMVGFSTRRAAPLHGLFKSFNKRVSSQQLALNIGAFAEVSMNSNSDGESLAWVYRRLLQQQNARRILLVLSDGQPACTHGDSYGHTQHIIKEIEKAGIVELCSIGILDETVKDLYSNWRVINRSDELEGAVLGVIKDHIISYS